MEGKDFGEEEDQWLKAKKVNGEFFIEIGGQWVKKEHAGVKILEEVFVKSPLARPPPNGYHSRINYSKKSIQWLKLLQHRAKKELEIQHALSARGEYKVPGTRYYLDGFSEPDADNPEGIAYEFLGCRFHGCGACIKLPDQVLNPQTGHTANELLALTMKKKEDLERMGMKVVSIWEHEFDAWLKADSEAKRFVDSLDIEDRLNPRESLMGGRTNGSVLYKNMPPGTKGKYVDFTSLYPFINKTCRYPVGHPTIITRNFKEDITSYFGIAKVKVLPPRGLFHGVLGYRSGGKLTFPLCRTCVDSLNQEPCKCSDKDRAFIGTYCTPELEKALEKGYQIAKIYEVYHWDETSQYDPESKTGGLFTQYINMFLKIKQEASGRPSHVKTEQDLEENIRLYEEKEGIRLDPDNIEFNAGLRNLGKLLLNSFWGKLAQRRNLEKNGICPRQSGTRAFSKDVRSYNKHHGFYHCRRRTSYAVHEKNV